MGKEEDFKWTEQLENTLNKYNNSEHRTIDMSPNEAKKRGNRELVSFNIWNNASRSRKYPDIEVEDKVRIKIKKKV